MTLCVGLSGVQRDTRARVDAVRLLRERTRSIDSLLGTLGEISLAGEQALECGDADELGRLFDVAHGVLAALRVSSLELDTLVHHARAAGALGAKLTGAGGGGAVIALAPGHEREVLDRWASVGYAGFLALIGSAATPTESATRGTTAPVRNEAGAAGAGEILSTLGANRDEVTR